MKIHLRFDKGNPAHQEITVFVNGRNTGKLIMSPAEATWFYQAVLKGCDGLSPKGMPELEFNGSGKCYYPTEDTPMYSFEEASK